jgi:hypothetical protein
MIDLLLLVRWLMWTTKPLMKNLMNILKILVIIIG